VGREREREGKHRRDKASRNFILVHKTKEERIVPMLTIHRNHFVNSKEGRALYADEE
jgi:hypothetical protein